MTDKPTDVSGGSIIQSLPGERLTITMADSTGGGAYQVQGSVVSSSGPLLEIEWEGKQIIVNTHSPNFIQAIRVK